MGIRDLFKRKLFKSNAEDNTRHQDYDGNAIDRNLEVSNGKRIIDHSIEQDSCGFEDKKTTQSTNNQENFRYLDELIHSGADEILLDCDIVLEDDESDLYREGIRLDVDDIIIDGANHEINARKIARIFDCTGKNITLRNLTFTEGHIERLDGESSEMERGGAIYVESNSGLRIENCTFSHNYANDGGAIFNKGTTDIIKSQLYANSAKDGGAIRNSKTLNITESSADSNSAKDGGAIYNWGELNVSKSHFTSNSAKSNTQLGGAGGAIFSFSGNARIEDSTFNHNVARTGACIKIRYGDLSITKSVFSNNTANYGSVISSNFSDHKIIIESSKLLDNYANNYGTIIHCKGSLRIFDCEIASNVSRDNIIINSDYLQINSTKFHENKSRHLIFNASEDYEYEHIIIGENDGNSNLTVDGTEFKGNCCEDSIIYNEGSNFSIYNSNFKDISPTNIHNKTEMTLKNLVIKNPGKTILNEGTIYIKSDIPEKIINNMGTVENFSKITYKEFDFHYLDKLIHESDTNEIVLSEDITFENYEIDFYEGGIDLDIDGLTIDGKGKTIDAKGKSRIFFITGNDITLKNIIFKNGATFLDYHNTLNNDGGALRIIPQAMVTLIDCKFTNHLSQQNGGAISSKGDLDIINCTFSNNTAKESGGVVSNEGELNISDSDFSQNTSLTNELTGTGGGVLFNRRGVLNITGSAFTNNKTERHGGSIFICKGNCTIINSRLSENETESNAGAICVDDGNLTIKNSVFSNNRAPRSSGDGGAIENISGNIDISDTAFLANTSAHGGAICNSGMLNISDSTFENNSTSISCGAIYSKDSNKLKLENCKFEGNSPSDVGYTKITSDFDF